MLLIDHFKINVSCIVVEIGKIDTRKVSIKTVINQL